jgi:putative copper resistance protein D
MTLLLVTLHLLGAIVWLGGSLFIGLVLVPTSRAFGETGQTLVRAAGRRFRWVAWPAIAISVGTGVVLAWQDGFLGALLDGTLLTLPRGPLFLVKAVLVLIALVLEGLHDWVLGAMAVRRERAATAANDPSLLAQAQALRKAIARVGFVNGGVVLAVVVAGVLLGR